MKKFLSLILSILIAFSMVSCGKTVSTPTRTYTSLSPFSLSPTTHDLQTSVLPATSDLTASPTPVQTTASAPPTSTPGSGCSIKTVYISGQDSTYGSYKGEGSYAKGGKVTLTATPIKDGGFLGWASDAKGTKIESYYNPYTFTVSKNVTLYPVFIKGSQIVVFKDEAVRKAVGSQSSYTYAELQKVEYMDIRNPKMLVDLAYFRSTLCIAICSDNKNVLNLSPLANLINLKNLYFSETALKDCDFEYLPQSLQELIFYECYNIKDFRHLSKLKNLTLLNIAHCRISDITSLGQMKQLEALWLYNNYISDLSPLSGLTNLKNLYIQNNRVTDLTPLKPLYTKCKDITVDIDYNPIKDYSFLKDAVCRFSFSMTNDQIAKTAAAAKEMVDSLIKPDMTVYERFTALAVGLCRRTTYDYTYNYEKHCDTAYGALINGTTVCAGYAEAYMMLCSMAGLPCYYIEGQTPGGSHAWNIVKLDGKYYHVDTTWMDDCDSYPISGYYFLKSDDFFLNNQHSDFVRAHDLICNDTSRDKDIGIIK